MKLTINEHGFERSLLRKLLNIMRILPSVINFIPGYLLDIICWWPLNMFMCGHVYRNRRYAVFQFFIFFVPTMENFLNTSVRTPHACFHLSLSAVSVASQLAVNDQL